MAGTRATDLSRALGKKDKNFVARIIAGQTSGAENLPAMAKLLGVDAGWLTTGAAALRPAWLPQREAEALADDLVPSAPAEEAPASSEGALLAIGRLTMENQALKAKLAQLDRDDGERAAKLRQLQADRDALEAQRLSLEAQLRDLSARLTELEARKSSRRGQAPVRGGKR